MVFCVDASLGCKLRLPYCSRSTNMFSLLFFVSVLFRRQVDDDAIGNKKEFHYLGMTSSDTMVVSCAGTLWYSSIVITRKHGDYL